MIDLRPGSGAAALYIWLFLAFFVIGAVLLLSGFDLDEVDRWLDARADLLDRIGTLIFKSVLAVLLLACALTIAGGLHQRFRSSPKGEPVGWGMMITVLVVGYFCWVGIVSSL